MRQILLFMYAFQKSQAGTQEALVRSLTKQGEAGSLHSHGVLHWKEGKDIFKRREPLTRDFALCQKSNSQWRGSR